MIKFLILLLTALPAIQIFAQEADSILSKFFATQVEDKILLRWTIEKGKTCEDTYVERSEDGIIFERIGLIGGICGSPDASITYEFYDTLPLKNRINLYRLILGQYGFTSIKTAEFIQYEDEGLIIAPNPFTDFTSLRFKNEKYEEYQLIVANLLGREMLQMTTTSGEFLISQRDLGSGIFLYRLLKSGKIIKEGKLLTY